MKGDQAIATYRRLRERALWRLLAADNGPIVLGLLETHLLAGSRSLPASVLYERLGRSLEDLRGQGQHLPQTAQAYVADWLAAGYLARRFPPGASEEEYELSAASEGAIRFVASLAEPRTAATESRLAVVMQQLLRLAEQTDANPETRIATLLAERQKIDEQIDAIRQGLLPSLADPRALERTREILNLAREDADPRRTVTLGPIRGEVRFENVSFEYEAGKPVLHEVSFEAAPGTVTALVGSSGSGKSTTIGLVSSFHAPREGRVMVDGIDLSTVRLDSYRSQLGVVLQESFLFDGTIRENVAFARPVASHEQIESACRTARVDEFVERFPEAYDTVVGERGVKLSGGQRQRVSIARAILADPRILILDEATSSLDSETEALIQTGLGWLMRGRTTFVIAHRLSTIRRADQILVMEGGRIVERGNHHELYALRGRYYDLYTRQHGLEANLFLAPGEGDAQ